MSEATPENTDATDRVEIAHDVAQLESLGYRQELSRGLDAFSNFAISFAIICILAGGVTSFHLGYNSVGPAAIGLGWPLVGAFALAVAATMGQIASAFPTAGGLYHWAAILGGRGWGWATAWFNLVGLVTVLAAINVGTYRFFVHALGPRLGIDPAALDPTTAFLAQAVGMIAITGSQAWVNHRGIRLTSRLTDFSGYWILAVAAVLTVAMLGFGGRFDLGRLVTFTNYSGPRGGNVWPETSSLAWLFALGALLPAYTITGFDASAHAAEETIGADRHVPQGIVRSVLISGLAGWVMLCAVVLAIPDLDEAAARGEASFHWAMDSVLPPALVLALELAIGLAQYLCGLATVTSASRMTFAFARDGGLPFSAALRRVSSAHQVPAVAIWSVAVAAVLFTLYSPVYSTITAVCTIFLYISYVLPTALGLIAYRRTWTAMGPWDLGPWFRPLAVVSLLGCLALLVIAVQPPNALAQTVVAVAAVGLVVAWFAYARRRFPGPPASLGRHLREPS